LVAGTVLLAIHYLDEVLPGKTTWAMWIKSAITDMVPYGIEPGSPAENRPNGW